MAVFSSARPHGIRMKSHTCQSQACPVKRIPFTATRCQATVRPHLDSARDAVPSSSPMQAAALAGALSFAGLLLVTTPAPSWAQAQQQPVSVTGPARVVDGDTLRVQDLKIRMFGIDAPEKAQVCKDAGGKDYNCGQVSLQALTNKLANESVRCNEVARDMYGRSVATCYVGGNAAEDVNLWMVQNGYAVAYRQYSKDYIPAEDAARDAKRGIWQGAFQMPADFRRQNKAAGLPASGVQAQPATASNSSIDLGDLMSSLFGAPASCPDPQIKGNINTSGEKIYHVPGGRSYKAVKIEPEKGERFFCSPKEAEAAGWRASKV